MAEFDLIKVKGVVTRSTVFKEHDRIITLLTADLGLISVYCHGARSNKYKYLTSTRLFCYSEFILTRKKDYYYIKEADYIESFFDISGNMDKLFLGQYFLEVVNEMCVEGERYDNVLRLLLNCLYALASNISCPKKIKAVFEMRMCAEMGLMPNTDSCRKCGKDGGITYFDLLNGDILCPECVVTESEETALRGESVLSVSYVKCNFSVIAAVKYVSTVNLQKVFAFSLTEEAMELFCRLCERYLIEQVGKAFITLELYREQIIKE